jgi:hypothetical protein
MMAFDNFLISAATKFDSHGGTCPFCEINKAVDPGQSTKTQLEAWGIKQGDFQLIESHLDNSKFTVFSFLKLNQK